MDNRTIDKLEIEKSISHIKDRIEVDLYFLGLDRKSDYAVFILEQHKVFKTAIDCMEIVLRGLK